MPASKQYLVDSDVLIDFLRGRESARSYLASLGSNWSISQVSAMELVVGAKDKREVSSIDLFLSAFKRVPLRQEVGETAYELLRVYSRSHGLQAFDAMVAATAIVEGLTLVSRNRKHFEMIDGLLFESPIY